MSMIHFVGGEKGGVGKSLMSRLLSQYFIDQSLTYTGLDADQSHSTLSRYYQDFTQPINLDVFESTDTIMELALSHEQQVLIDLPAQSQRFLDRWIEENGVLGLCEDLQISLVYWYLVDDGHDSAQLLSSFLKKYQKSLRCVVVKNFGRGQDFSEIDSLPAVLEAEASVQQLALPALHAETLRRIDKLNFSFWAAINTKEAHTPHLSLMERQRTRVWTRKVNMMIDTIMQAAANSQ